MIRVRIKNDDSENNKIEILITATLNCDII